MNKISISALLLGITVAAPLAHAQNCPQPGAWLCAELTIGGGVTPQPQQVVVQPQQVVVQPQPIVYQPPPPPVVYQPPPRVVYLPPPPPRVVVVPQRVYVQQQPMVVYPQQTQVMVQQQYWSRPQNSGYWGVSFAGVGSFLGTAPGVNGIGFIGGGMLGLRVRNASGHLGGELGVGFVGGRDYNGDSRREIPVTLTGMYYFNPQNRLQVYGLAGLGMSYAMVDYVGNNSSAHGGLSEARYLHIGGYAGLGLEWQLSNRFSLFADVRGFVRGRVDDSAASNPEFARTTETGATQTSNLSGGVATQLGAAIYF